MRKSQLLSGLLNFVTDQSQDNDTKIMETVSTIIRNKVSRLTLQCPEGQLLEERLNRELMKILSYSEDNF